MNSVTTNNDLTAMRYQAGSTRQDPDTELVVRQIYQAFPYLIKERIRQAVYSCRESIDITMNREKFVSCTLERLGLTFSKSRSGKSEAR